MQNEKYLELDALAAPNGYVAPPTSARLASGIRSILQRLTRTNVTS